MGTPLYITPNGNYFVTYNSLDGTYDVRLWPSLEIVANRDSKGPAIELAGRLAGESQ